MARFSLGHDQRVSLSPVTAIADMVAPVVLITLATIFANGLLAYGSSLAAEVFAMDRERLGILRGPGGELLDEDSVPPADRERLTQIGGVVPLMVGRVRHVRLAVLIIWIAIGLLIVSVAAVAVAVTARSEGFAFAALGLVLAGVAGVFAGIASMIGPASRSADLPIERTWRGGMLR